MIKIIDDIDVQPILDFYYEIENSNIWHDTTNKGKQAGLQHKLGDDPWLSGTGRKYIGSELVFSQINPFFIGTIFEDIIKKYNLFRTRLIWMYPESCYSMHHDTLPRIHIPLITNNQSYFLFLNSNPIHLQTGKVYWLDTRLHHSAMNGSNKDNRLHLVGVTFR